MKILVAVKRVIDPYVKIRVKTDETGVEIQNTKMSMNPFDEIALEEAIRLQEQNLASEVIVTTIGTNHAEETLRQALALGASRAILIKTDTIHCSLNIAKILKSVVIQVEPMLVLMGKQSIDGDNNQTPQMLAGLLNWPQATYASKVILQNNKLQVTREVDGGLEVISMPLPAVVSTDLRLNEPRYASLPNIMKAKRKPLDVIEQETLNLVLKQHNQIISVKAPPKRANGIKLDSIQSLVDKLTAIECLARIK